VKAESTTGRDYRKRNKIIEIDRLIPKAAEYPERFEAFRIYI
jgi:hypothetical protein